MKHPRLMFGAVGGVLALVLSPLAAGVARAAPKPHSDQVITVTKTAAGTGAPLAGAVFTLYKWHGSPDLSSVVATATSDSNGHAVFNLEGHHNYWVVETAAPSGYVLPTSGQLVKTSHSTNAKGQDDRANVKESEAATFVDQATGGGGHDNPPVTTPTGGNGGTTGGGGSSTGATTSAGGGIVPQATTVHTGLPWAGSTPYALGAGALGMSLLGTGLVLRRRQLHRVTS